MNLASLAAFKEHADAEHPREACGLLVNVNGREAYLACRNIAETPREHFVLHPEDYLQATQAGELLAICHSHPNASAMPSAADRAACEASALPWYVMACPGYDIQRIEPCGFKAPLLQREFVHGVHDCYSLVRDYYAETLNLHLPDFARADLWWDKGQNLYEENFAACGFRQVTEARPHDAILMQIRSPVPNHAGVLMADLAMLHHLYGHLSGRTVYGGYWQKNTVKILRHESLQ